MILTDIRPLLSVSAALAACVLILFSGRHPNIRETWSVIAACIMAAVTFSMVPGTLAGIQYEFILFQATDTLSFVLRTDPAGILFACISSFLYIPVSFYAIGYMRRHHEKNQTGFYSFFALCMCSAAGIAMSGNLITFFIFFEMLTIATWPLVFHERTVQDRFSGRKYLIYTLIPGQLLLSGIVILYGIGASMDFIPGGSLQGMDISQGLCILLFILLICAGGVKAGMMPFHGWLPSAMVAPTPVSALLHAVAVVKAGAFCVIRMIGYVFGPQILEKFHITDVFIWVAVFTILCSSLIAMKQDNLKKRLAYSTVGQLSYIILGSCLLTESGFQGAFFHIAAHAFMKITLFMCAGAIIVTTHKNNISEMHGIGKQMPITLTCYTIGALGIAGMPFIIGFVSKWNLALGAMEAGKPVFIAVLVVSALLSLTYLMPLTHLGFFKKNTDGNFVQFKEADPFMLIPIIIITVFCILFGILPNFGIHLYDLASMAAHSLLY